MQGGAPLCEHQRHPACLLVVLPSSKAFTKKTCGTVNIKGNRVRRQCKSGAGYVVDADDTGKQVSSSSSSEEYDDTPELGSTLKGEVQTDKLVRATEERAANGLLASPSLPFAPPHRSRLSIVPRLIALTEPVKSLLGTSCSPTRLQVYGL